MGFIYIERLSSKFSSTGAKYGDYVGVGCTLRNTDSRSLCTKLVAYSNGRKFDERTVCVPGYGREDISWLFFMQNRDLVVTVELIGNCDWSCKKSITIPLIAERTKIEVTDIKPDSDVILVGEPFTLHITFSAVGGEVKSTAQFGLYVNGELVDNTIFVTLSPGESTTVDRELRLNSSGIYEICVEKIAEG